MTTENKVSIVIVNYLTYELVVDCIESIKTHTRGINYEIIVVDNGSTSAKAEILISKYPDVKFILLEKNVGFATANNIGVEKATGEYLLILNNDTIFIEDTLSIIAKMFEGVKGESIIGCKLLNADKTLQDSAIEFDNITNSIGEAFFLYLIFKKSKMLNKYHLQFKQITEITETGYVKGAFMFMLKSTYDKLGGFDENFYFYAEEADLCMRFSQQGGKVLYYPGTKIIHLGGATTDSMPWFMYKNVHIAALKMYQKNYSFFERVVLITLSKLGKIIRVFMFALIGLLSLNKNLLVKSIYYIRQLAIYPQNKFK